MIKNAENAAGISPKPLLSMPGTKGKRKLLLELQGSLSKLVEAWLRFGTKRQKNKLNEAKKFWEHFYGCSVNAAVCSLCEVISRARAKVGHLDFFAQKNLAPDQKAFEKATDPQKRAPRSFTSPLLASHSLCYSLALILAPAITTRS